MVGRNRFFFPSQDSRPFSLTGGLEAWKGFYSSVRPTHKQLMVNVNGQWFASDQICCGTQYPLALVCTTAFYTPGNLAKAMEEFRNASFGARVSGFVKGVRVKTTHLGYKKTVKSLFNKTPREHSFDCEEFRAKLTVEEYFKRSKKTFYWCTYSRYLILSSSRI